MHYLNHLELSSRLIKSRRYNLLEISLQLLSWQCEELFSLVYKKSDNALDLIIKIFRCFNPIAMFYEHKVNTTTNTQD